MLLDARKIHPRGRELPLRPRGCPEGRTAAEPEKKKRDLGCEQNNRKLESFGSASRPERGLGTDGGLKPRLFR